MVRAHVSLSTPFDAYKEPTVSPAARFLWLPLGDSDDLLVRMFPTDTRVERLIG